MAVAVDITEIARLRQAIAGSTDGVVGCLTAEGLAVIVMLATSADLSVKVATERRSSPPSADRTVRAWGVDAHRQRGQPLRGHG